MLLGVPVIHRITRLRSREQKKKKKTESHNEVQANEVAKACGPLCMCLHLHIGVSKRIKYTITLACVHSCVVKRKKVRHITDSWVTHSAPGNVTFPCPCLVWGTTWGWSQGGKEGSVIRQGGGSLFFCTNSCTLCVYLPLPPFPLHQNPFILPLIPTHQLVHLLVCKLKATLEIFRQRAHIFWYATDSKGLFFFFLYGNACYGATWKSPLLHFIHLFVPPHGARRDLVEMEGSQQSVPLRGREWDIEAILQWFPKWYLSVWVFLVWENNTVLRRCW